MYWNLKEDADLKYRLINMGVIPRINKQSATKLLNYRFNLEIPSLEYDDKKTKYIKYKKINNTVVIRYIIGIISVLFMINNWSIVYFLNKLRSQ